MKFGWKIRSGDERGGSGLLRKRPSRRHVAMVAESLESRALFAVTPTQSVFNLEFAAGQTTQTFYLAGTFGTDTLGAGARAYSGSVVQMVINKGGTVQTVNLELDDMRLSNRSAPLDTVSNFLSYVKNSKYDNTVFHRSLNFTDNTKPAQFLQGGGFSTDTAGLLTSIDTGAPINLDFSNDRPNVAGTIAMARTNQPNSATSGFFFNTIDNSGVFNAQNKYAVFGQVIGSGQQALTDLSSLLRIDAKVPFGSQSNLQTFQGFPVVNYPTGTTPAPANYLTLQSATLKDQLSFQLTNQSNLVYATVGADGTLTLNRNSVTSNGVADLTVTAIDLAGNRANYTLHVTFASPILGVTLNSVSQTPGAGTTDIGPVDLQGTKTAVLGIRNTGNAPLVISSITLPTGFTFAGSAPSSVAAGDTANITLKVDSATPGRKAGQVVINSNDAVNPAFKLQILSTVLQPPGIRVAVNDSSVDLTNIAPIDFGKVVAGTGSTQKLTLTNTSSAGFNVTSIQLPAGFLTTQSFPLTVPANQSVDLSFTLDASVSGAKSGNLVITSTDAFNPQLTVPLSAVVYKSVVLNNKTVKSVVFTESDGTIGTLALIGAGTLEARFLGTNLRSKLKSGVLTVSTKGAALDVLNLSGTNARSQVVLKSAGKNKQVNVGSVTQSGPSSAVGVVDLAPAVLTGGDSTLAGAVTSLTLAGMSSATLQIGTAGGKVAKPKTTLDLGSVLNSLVSVQPSGTFELKAKSINRSDMLSAAKWSTFTVSGSVTSSRVEAASSIGTLTVGKLVSSKVFAGTIYAGLDGSAQPPTSVQELGNGSIGSVTVTGKSSSFSGTVIAAGRIGSLSLGLLNASTSSSIIANQITTIAGKVGTTSFSLKTLTDDAGVTAALKKAKVSLPAGVTVKVY